MRYIAPHPWNLTPKEAIDLQKHLAGQVIRTNQLKQVAHVAGVDVGFENNNQITRAAVAVLSYPELELIEYKIARRPTKFPYIPGLLSFREIPAILDALNKLDQQPDLVLCDGQGLAHPRRFGIACHLGVITDIPTIGVGKTRLIGEHDTVPTKKGTWTELTDKNETIGAVLRSRTGVKPVYVSSGHKVNLKTAIKFVMGCITHYKLPETTRWTHKLASEKKD